MAHQNDLTTERTSALKLAKALIHAWFRKTDMFKNDAVIGFSKPEWDDLDKYIAEALQQTRQDALREAITIVEAEQLENDPTNDEDRAYFIAIEHAIDALDRLVSEGS